MFSLNYFDLFLFIFFIAFQFIIKEALIIQAIKMKATYRYPHYFQKYGH